MTVALIDGDIVAYRAAASCEKKDQETGEMVITEPLEIAIARVDNTMSRIANMTNAISQKTFLSGDTNFREEVNPEYKANRKGLRRPEYLQACKEYLVVSYGAQVTDGYEADDALGINQTDDTIICSIDKDLLMIPGKHFNFVKEELSEVSDVEGLKAFYRQMYIGDTTDNIFGIKGIGKAKAAKIIDPLESEIGMYEITRTDYDDDDRFWMNLDCLWIMRNEGERYSDVFKRRETNNIS